jgi:putative oxidoreductase
MKIVALIARILLGLIFLVFGLNFFFQFIHGAMPTGLAGQFAGALFQSHYALFVGAVQAIGGALLLSGFFVPLGLVLLGAEIVNILCFHIFLAHSGIGTALLVTVLWIIVFIRYRQHFTGILTHRAP